MHYLQSTQSLSSWGSHLHMTFSPCTCSFLTHPSVTFPFLVYNFLSEVAPGLPPLGRGDLSSAGNVPIASSMVLFHSTNCFVLKTLFFTGLWFVWDDSFFFSLKKILYLFVQQGLHIFSCPHFSSDPGHIPRPVMTMAPSCTQPLGPPPRPSHQKTQYWIATPLRSLPLFPQGLLPVSVHLVFPLYVSVPIVPFFIQTPVILN